mgnify:FL=1|tara:strand:+ start:110 stop:934 length:825 start_codon:yes stop_codon:yes gene_type:complete
MPLVLRKKGEGNKKKKMPKAPPSRPRHANPKHPMNTERTTGRNMARKKGGGKLKMVEKDGKKVPFFAADGIGKMNKGGPVEVKKGMTLSQIAKNNNTSIQALLAANPSIKNANQIRIGQKIKMPKAGSVPGNTKTKNPYARMSKTQMNMMRSKDKGQQRAVTSAMRNEAKNTGAQTTPTPKKARAVKDSRSAVPQAQKDKLIAKAKANQSKKPKKKSLLSRLFGGNKKKPAVPSNDIAAKKGGVMKKKVRGYKSGGTVRGAGAATKGKRFTRAG